MLSKTDKNSTFFMLMRYLYLATGFSNLWYSEKWIKVFFWVYCKFAQTTFVVQILMIDLYCKKAIDDFDKDWRESVFYFCATVETNMVLYKFLLYNSGIMKKLVKEAFLYDTSVQAIPHPEIRKASNDYGYTLFKIFVTYILFLGCMFVCVYSAGIVFYFIGRNCDTRFEECFRKLPWLTVSWFDIDTQYGYTLFSTIAGCSFMGFIVSSTNLTYIALSCYPVFKLKHLQEVLSNFQQYGYLRSKQENIPIEEGEYSVVRECVIEHQKIISDCTKMRMYTRTMFFFEFFTRATQIAPYLVIMMSFTTKIEYVMVIAFFAMSWLLCQLFMVYWFSQELIDESVNVGTCISRSNWYEADVRTQKMLLMIMIRSNKHLALTVGPFYDMQLELFLKIMKSIYTLITILRNTMPSSL